MDNSAELRCVIDHLPDICRAGDIAGYLAHYAADISVCVAGTTVNLDEVSKFIVSLFEDGSRALEFQIGSRDVIQLSESGDAAIVNYPWRERFATLTATRLTPNIMRPMSGTCEAASERSPMFI